MDVLTQSKRDGSAAQEVHLVHARHGSDAALRLEWRRALAAPGAAAYHQAFAKANAVVADHYPIENADVVQHGVRAVAVVEAFTGILLHVQPSLEMPAVAYLVADTMVERVATIAAGRHLLSFPII